MAEPRIAPGIYILDDAPDFVLKDGLVHVRSRSGGVEFAMAVTVNQFYKASERARRLREEIADRSGAPTPIKG